jgi:hypothetical protein
MAGNLTQYVNLSNNTAGDDGQANVASIQPIQNGEAVNSTVLDRPLESLRQRDENFRSTLNDTLYLRDADRNLILAGPGLVTWPGSTTASASGIPVITDNLYIMPMLTPGSAQTPPIPPVASNYGTIFLTRASDSTDTIQVQSLRRSYFAGDQINITVSSGSAFSCTLAQENIFSRTISIVATGSTTLGTVVSALNALVPASPGFLTDNTAIVNATLVNGGLSSDIITSPQAQQYMSGNYDGEGHTITPANLASFFSTNPSEALAEGDTLCIQYASLEDLTDTGGRRQSIPENSNTAIPAGSFFNSRVHPEHLVNCLGVCKVVNGALVFSTGTAIAAGTSNASIGVPANQSRLVRNGNFEHGNSSDSTWYAISDWENRTDLATNGAWIINSTAPLTGSKNLALNVTSAAVVTAQLQQTYEVPVVVGQIVQVVCNVRQLASPSAGTCSVILNWGDLNSNQTATTTIALQVLSSTDSSYRNITQSVSVPSGVAILKSVYIKANALNFGATTGVNLLIDDLQIVLNTTGLQTPGVDIERLQARNVGATVFEDNSSFVAGNIAALAHYLLASPSGEGTLFIERKDKTYDSSHLPPAVTIYGRLLQLGAQLLATSANSYKARIDTPYSSSFDYLLVWQSLPVTGSNCGMRLYASSSAVFMTNNASWNGSDWDKDVTGTTATMWEFGQGFISQFAMVADSPWTTWTPITKTSVAQATTTTTPVFTPLLQGFDASGNTRVVADHLGLPSSYYTDYSENWALLPTSSISTSTVIGKWTFTSTGSGNIQQGNDVNVASAAGYYGLAQSFTISDTSFSEAATAALFRADGASNWPGLNQILMAEWETQSSLTGSSNGLAVSQGFLSSSRTQSVNFNYSGAVSANWELIISNGSSSTVVNTGVAISSTPQRMRLECYGGNHPGGQRYLAYINGVLVAQVLNSAGTSPTTNLQMQFATSASGITASGSVTVGPVTCYLQRFVNDDAL